MAERTKEEIAKIFSIAADSVAEINAAKGKTALGNDNLEETTDTDYKNRIKRNVLHLESIKAYKTEADDTVSIWTTEDFTAIDAAITKGKSQS
jgi:hypothetical protein